MHYTVTVRWDFHLCISNSDSFSQRKKLYANNILIEDEDWDFEFTKKKRDLFQVTVSTATFNFIPHVSIWLIRSFTTFIYNEMLCWWEIKKLISQEKNIIFPVYIHSFTCT